MTDEQQTPEQPASSDAWREVGEQFESLGQSLATAFRTMWEREENRQHVDQIKAGLENMANEVAEAVKQAADSAEGEEVKQHMRKAADSAQQAGKQAFDEARPHLLSALQQVTGELQKVIDKWEPGVAEADDTPAEPPAE